MILLPALIIFIAFFVESALGFGGGLIAIPLLGFIFPMAQAVAIVMVFQFLVALLILKTYKDVAWTEWKKFLPGMIAGVLLGSISLKYFDDNVVRIFLALFILFYLVRTRLKVFPNDFGIRNIHALSFCGGWIMGLIGAGGPLYVVYFKEHTKDKKSFRASLIMAFFLTNLIRIPGYLSAGIMTMQTLQIALFAMPFFLLSLWTGYKAHDRIPEKAFHNVVDVLLLIASLSLITKVVL